MHIDDCSNAELVTIAVAILGGETRYVDREDIAIEVNIIAPGRFNWRKHPERIDLVAVVYALRDAKKPKNGGFLTGSNARGWMLSPSGTKWIEQLDLTSILEADQIKHRKDSVSAILETECRRLRSTKAYELFTAGNSDQISLQDFYQFARVNEYFQTRARRRRYALVDNAVVNDEILSNLWRFLRNRFKEEIT